MPETPAPRKPPASPPSSSDRLDSWKEIAGYLRRDVTTVQRWEKREGMPVHRHQHDRMGSVYAFRNELDAWARSRTAEVVLEDDSPAGDGDRIGGAVVAGGQGAVPPVVTTGAVLPAVSLPRSRRLLWLGLGAALVAMLGVWALRPRSGTAESLFAGARFQPLTDFEGIEQAAALSRDGRFVAFQSDREGRMDVWVTQVGTGRFTNLTRGTTLELVNPSVRTLGFSPDGSLVTFWGRPPAASAQSEISIWAAPLLGGPLRL